MGRSFAPVYRRPTNVLRNVLNQKGNEATALIWVQSLDRLVPSEMLLGCFVAEGTSLNSNTQMLIELILTFLQSHEQSSRRNRVSVNLVRELLGDHSIGDTDIRRTASSYSLVPPPSQSP
jgi:hypothetical protein